MTDIILRMKALPDLTNEMAWEVVYEGAKEIERLRAEVERLNGIYDSAVGGRMEFRSAFVRERQRADRAELALAEVHAVLDREIDGAQQTLKLDLTTATKQSADGWLNAAKGIQIAVSKIWPRPTISTPIE
jgi:hypothetical protein